VKRYANVTPSLSGCRQSTRTSRISPLCPTMSVNASGRLAALTTLSSAPEAERSASVQGVRLPPSVRMCAGKLVAARRLSRRSWGNELSSKLVLTSDQDVNDLTDRRLGVLRRRRWSLLLDGDGHALLLVRRHTSTRCLQLRRSKHREVVIRRNADHHERLLPWRALASGLKIRLKHLISEFLAECCGAYCLIFHQTDAFSSLIRRQNFAPSDALDIAGAA
jgi:hypothetical protein